jgi:ribA/ribD-fused uncharacterized protein
MKTPALTRRRKTNSTATNSQNGNHEIRFYRANEKPYGVFSNLFRRPMLFEGKKFPTAEHAYQAAKPKRAKVQEWILNAPTPSLVAMAAHGLYTWEIASNWSQIKYARMRKVLRAKFSQHQDLSQILLSTGDARIVEVGRVDSPANRTWGEVNGKGKNLLGVLLMEIRTELRTTSDKASTKSNGKKSKPRASGR